MTRSQAIDTIKAKLDALSNEQLRALADMADAFSREVSDECEATRDAIAEGLREIENGKFATEAEVAAAFARFRS